jgi:methylated-DNA-[protein]-cysteine S-methyltransferase
MECYQAKLAAPFAVLGVRTTETAVVGLDYLPLKEKDLAPQNRLAEQACLELQAYLDDPAFPFRFPLLMQGTPHQLRVWRALKAIPLGKTLSYGALAQKLHSGPRAVGQACGSNPLPLVVPCHRVLAKNGLGGFMRGRAVDHLEIKRWLLYHEGVLAV